MTQGTLTAILAVATALAAFGQAAVAGDGPTALAVLAPGAVEGDAAQARAPSASEAPPTASPRPPADLPLSHWAYPLLERLVSRGVLELDLTTRPVHRSAVANALARRCAGGAARHEPDLTSRELWALDKLEAEFLRGEVDAPSASVRNGAAVVGLGIGALTQYSHTEIAEPDTDGGGAHPSAGRPSARGAPDEQPDVTVDVWYEFWGGVCDNVGFYSEADVLLGGQEDARIEELSNRARSWRGISAVADLAYVKLERPQFSVTLGRNDAEWGRSTHGGLLFSGTAATIDGLSADFSVGALSLQALHGFLEYTETGSETDFGEDEHVFVAAHRISVSGPVGSISAGEAVVYSSVMPDPVYLNPLVPFYLSQHNEREDDNVLWTLDFLLRPRAGMDVYGEFLVDDLQYERSTESPDKYAATVGAVLYGEAAGADVEVGAEYSHVRKWTYTHHVIEHRVEQDGEPLGFELGPDADRLTVEVLAHPAPTWSVGLSQSLSRKGEGTLLEAFEEGENPEPAFPSGVVETTQRTALDLAYDNLRGLEAFLSVAYASITNKDNGTEDDDGWEVSAGIGFRI